MTIKVDIILRRYKEEEDEDNNQTTTIINKHEEDFTTLKTLGSGGFGTCYKAIHKKTQFVCCIKKINRTSKKNAALQSYNAETKSEFFDFEHQNIVKLIAATSIDFYAFDKDLSSLLMVFEYIPGQNLHQLLEDEQEIIDLARMCRFGQDIASALDYVHQKGIIHLDVKPSNIMVTSTDVCKLADFGCSQYLESDPVQSESLLTGTFAYRAPELHRGLSPTPECDVYAVGISLWQFWSREMPFGGTNQHVVIYNVVQNNLRPDFDLDHIDTPNETYKELATQCWSNEPSNRPTLCTVIETLSSLLS
uniref:non-specific serine/threonine protein kinase n=1 Tax=Clytia hemisphaerica TaxID=252671 RepID=C0J9J1_9CNID|nr:protein kinase Mos1 [Clytia hemisphaerica]